MEHDEVSSSQPYAALRRSLGDSSEVDGFTTARGLCEAADTLVLNYGRNGSVNHMSARLSAGYVQRDDLADHPLYVRLAKLKKPGAGDELPFIIFSETADIHAKTQNMRALRFQEYVGDISLRIDLGMEPLINEPEYLALAAELIKAVGEQSIEIVAADKTAKDARRKVLNRAAKSAAQSVRSYFNDNNRPQYYSAFDTLGERRKFTLGASVLALILTYSHLPFGDIDAKLGPVPMPQPIELIVDLDNSSDHAAQGFKEPPEAADLRIGDKDIRLPLLDNYETKGVPDATFSGGTSGSTSDDKEVSKPGLYRVDYETSNTRGKCMTVKGNFRSGKSSVFTQDIPTADNVRLSVRNATELEVCTVEGGSAVDKGSFYIWQDK